MPTLKHGDYNVGMICALPTELTAAMAMLDEMHSPLPQHPSDYNAYTLGRMGVHDVVIGCLPFGKIGTNSAAIVAAHMVYSFPSLKFTLLVGIGGGIPSPEHDIRLGDVVVSKPGSYGGGVIQYDYGKTVEGGKFVHTGSLDSPPMLLLTALNKLEAEHELNRHNFTRQLEIPQSLQPTYNYPGAENDCLFEAEYNHVGNDVTCEYCDVKRIVERKTRPDSKPYVHYGAIGSANEVIRDAPTRDALGKKYRLLCFEMEAAGLMCNFPCAVIRGICDYSDSHKNKAWQPYAALAAAAHAKALLSVIPPEQVANTSSIPPAPLPESLSSFSNVGIQSNNRSDQTTPVLGALTSIAENGNSFLVFKPLSFNSVALGRLVINPHAPWEDYCPVSLKLKENDIGILAQPRLRELIHNTRGTAVYDKFINRFSLNEDSLETIASASEKTYILSNSGNWFKGSCSNKEIRLWLETMAKNRLDIYMIVGIHIIYSTTGPGIVFQHGMQQGHSTAVNIGTTAPFLRPGELIVAVEYRKVQFHWFWSRDVDRAFLEIGCNRWELGVIIRTGSDDEGEELDEEEEEDIIEATLQDYIMKEDIEVTGEVLRLSDQLVLV
jgi:nucleoside phosphorylase